MPCHIVERTFHHGLAIRMNGDGAAACLTVVGNNAQNGVTWARSYVTPDKGKTVCIYGCTFPRGRPDGRPAQWPAGGSHYPGQRTGPLFLSVAG